MAKHSSNSTTFLIMVLLFLLALTMAWCATAVEISEDYLISDHEEEAHTPRIAIDRDGYSHILYYDRDFDEETFELIYRRIDPFGEVVEGPIFLTPPGAEWAGAYDITVDDDGRVHVVTCAMVSYDAYDLYYCQLDLDGNFQVPMKAIVSSSERYAYLPSMDTDGSGNVYIAFTEYDEGDLEMWISWMKLTPAGTVSIQPTKVSHETDYYDWVYNTQIGVGASGVSYITYDFFPDSGNPEVYFVSVSSTGSVLVDATAIRSNPLLDYAGSQAGLDSSENMHVTYIMWSQIRGVYSVGYAKVDSNGVVQDEKIFQDTLVRDIWSVDLAVDTNDDVYLVFTREVIPNQHNYNVYLALFNDATGEWESTVEVGGDDAADYDMDIDMWDGFGAIAYQMGYYQVHLRTLGDVSANRPPTPRLSFTPMDPEAYEEVTFDGSASDDPDDGDHVAEFLFEWGDGGSSGWTSSDTATHAFTSAGTYSASLRVRDSQGLESTHADVVSIVISAPSGNIAPTAVITADITSPREGQQVTFYGTDSTDPDGSVTHFWFDFGDGEGTGWVTSAVHKHSYPDEGTYVAALKVKDDDGMECRSEDTVTITVVHLNGPPTATIRSITPNPAKEGQEVTFLGEAKDVDGSIMAYMWESDLDRIIGTTVTFTTADLQPGLHEITFKVRDDEAAWSEVDTAELVITANQPFTVEDRTVLPDDLDTESSVRFRVLYTDADNDAPTTANILVDDGSGWETFPLEEADVTDTDYTDGKEYFFHLKTDTPGKYRYSFEFANVFDPSKKTEVVELTVTEPSGFIPSWGSVGAVVAIATVTIVGIARRRT